MPSVANGFGGRFNEGAGRSPEQQQSSAAKVASDVSPEMLLPARAFATGVISGALSVAEASVVNVMDLFTPATRRQLSAHCQLALPEHAKIIRKHLAAMFELIKE